MNNRSWGRLIAVLFVLFLMAIAAPSPAGTAIAAGNAITTENQQPGSSGWQLGSLVANDASGQVKGYASATSVLPGESLTLYVTVNPAQTYSVDIYRIGWYGGLGGRLRLHAGPIAGVTQPGCPTDAITGMIACSWASGYSFTVPSDWTSGVYLGVLTNAAGYQNYVVFVVRDGRPAAFLYQHAVNTDAAYNNWPNDGSTGKSLYDYNSFGANTMAGTTRAVKVSLDRPFSNDGSGLFLNWEIQLVRWLERSGYDVTYSTDVDTHANGSELLNHKAFFSTGHDEYWTNEMVNAAADARDAGVNLAFFGANPVYRQVRYEASAAGVPNRVVVHYRNANLDPIQGPTTTTQFRDPPVNRPEQVLVGVQWTNEVNWGNNVPYVMANSSSWVYASTGVSDGDAVPGIVGYEMDRYMPGYPPPNATTWTLFSHSPFIDGNGSPDYSNSSIYQAPSGAWVFATGTMSWSWGLDSFNNAGIRTGVSTDVRIQQTTANVLNTFLSGLSVVNDLKVTAPASTIAGQAFSVTVTAEDAQGNPVGSYNGTVHFASSDSATGVVLPADSTLVNGQGSFSATLVRAGPQTLTVSDSANRLSTTVTLTVNAAPASKLAVTSTKTSTTAGSSVPFTVTAVDPYGNTSSGYAGTVHFTTSDPAPGAMPPDSTLSNGQRGFSATLDTAGAQTIVATDTQTPTLTGALAIQVVPAVASSISLAVPGTVKANQPFNVTVTLKDAFGNLATGYRGTTHFTSSDLVAQTAGKLPADYTFAGADAGSHVFSVTLVTPPGETLTVTDTARPTLTTTSRSINVTLL